MARGSHLPLGPKDHGAFGGTSRCREGSLPFGVPRLVLSILGTKAGSWPGKALEGLVPGAPALGVARPRAGPLGFFHPSCGSHLHWSGVSQGGGQ